MEELLELLESDARLTPAQLAERTGRSEEEVKAVLGRLEAGGVIRRYKTVVDWERAGVESRPSARWASMRWRNGSCSFRRCTRST